MTLSQAYFLLAVVSAVPALALVFRPAAVAAFPRAVWPGRVLFAAAGAWFVHTLVHLGEPDLAGIPRAWVVGAFGVSIVAAFRLLPDFLGVRGLAGLLLLGASPVLDAGFGRVPHSLLLASLTYALIFFAIVVGTAPYLMRDLIAAVLRTPARVRGAAAGFAVAAAACAVNGFVVLG